MKIPFEWDLISNEFLTHRAKVHGGWLIHTETTFNNDSIACSEALIFIPDITHEWEIE